MYKVQLISRLCADKNRKYSWTCELTDKKIENIKWIQLFNESGPKYLYIYYICIMIFMWFL